MNVFVALCDKADVACRLTELVERARIDGLRQAEEARSSAVAPLRSELANIRAAAEDMQAAYASDVAKASPVTLPRHLNAWTSSESPVATVTAL